MTTDRRLPELVTDTRVRWGRIAVFVLLVMAICASW